MKKFFFIIFTVFLVFSYNPSLEAQERNYYQELVNEWSKIFPDRNRNAAGPKFFKHILNKDITYQEFVEFNKLYCAVSGSLIDPKFKDVEKEFYVLTIKNPCGKKNFPNQVNRDYFCDGESLSKDQVVELNNRLVIGLFHQAKSCDKSEIVKIDNHQVTGLFCEFRNNTPDEQLQSGMGDIFIKLAR